MAILKGLSAMARELAAARRDLELLLKLLNKARDEQTRAKQAAEPPNCARPFKRSATGLRGRTTNWAAASELRKSMLQLEKTADAGTTDLRKSLQQERDRASKLEQDLAVAQRDVETQKSALAVKAGEEAARLTVAESGSAALRQSLQQEHDRVSQLGRDLALARNKENAPAAFVASADQTRMQNEAEVTRPAVTEQAVVADARADAPSIGEDAEDVARLVTRANVLLGRGDIGSARMVLARAAEAGNPKANFKLAET
jgi:hypothetical protein